LKYIGNSVAMNAGKMLIYELHNTCSRRRSKWALCKIWD